LNGLLTGKWHKYKYDGGISGWTHIYPDSVYYEYVFYRDTVINPSPDSINACKFYNDSLIGPGFGDLT
jgi:hypothetical protein